LKGVFIGPDPLPVTEAELDVIETHFADFLDELFGERLGPRLRAPAAEKPIGAGGDGGVHNGGGEEEALRIVTPNGSK
jgi:hypothetical protein